MAILTTKDLCKTYGSGDNAVHALNHVSLTVEEGEFVSTVGTSGSGKSTFLNLVGGLDKPTSGEVWVRGHDLGQLSDEQLTIFRRRNIGFVFQNFNLIPMLNVYENITFTLETDGLRPDKEFLDGIIQALGLEEKCFAMPDQLSGGQRQRVAIARALAKNPKLLLCDEPTGALDYVTGKAILKLLQDTCRLQGMTVVVITHNTALTPMADRVIHIKNGRVEEMTCNPNPTPVEAIEW